MASKDSTETSSNRPVLVSNLLLAVIEDTHNAQIKSSPSLFAHLTMDELLMQMKNYIMTNKLFDPENPIQIVLHENQLAKVFEKSEFSLLEFNDLLKKFVIPVPEKNTEVNCSINEKICISKKRKMDNATEFSAKKVKFLETSCSDRESDESTYTHSIKNYETDCVKKAHSDGNDNFSDGSDNFSGGSSLIIAEAFDVDVEYEITHTDDTDFSSCESDSDLEDFVKSAIINFIASSYDSDLEYLADSSSSDSDTEKEISEEDEWCCPSCNTFNDPLMRFCAACWCERVGWMSEGAKTEIYVSESTQESKRKNFTRKSKRKLSKKLNKNKVASPPNCKLSDLPSETAERNDLSSLSLSLSPSFTQCNGPDSKENTSTESLSLSPPSSSSPLLIVNSLSTNSNQSPSNMPEVNKHHIKTDSDKQLCLFCCENPADSTVIHGKIGCKICCFQCGKKLIRNKFSEKRCPVCRRNIEKIVYLYNC